MNSISLTRDGQFRVRTPTGDVMLGDHFEAVFTGKRRGERRTDFDPTKPISVYYFELQLPEFPEPLEYTVASKIVGPYLNDVLEKGTLQKFKAVIYTTHRYTWYQPIVDDIPCGLFGARWCDRV